MNPRAYMLLFRQVEVRKGRSFFQEVTSGQRGSHSGGRGVRGARLQKSEILRGSPDLWELSHKEAGGMADGVVLR